MEQNKIDELIGQLKRLLLDNNIITIPSVNSSEKLEAKSQSKYFYIDLNRKGSRIKRFTLQLRCQERKDLPLLRFDLVGPPHENPPGNFPYAGESIPCPHLHIAHEDFGDRIAYPLDGANVNMELNKEELNDFVKILQSFLNRCNVINVNTFQFSSIQEDLGI